MRTKHLTILFFVPFLCMAQRKGVAGKYIDNMPRVEVNFLADSTFEYSSTEMHPVFYRWEDFYEKGKWTMSGDTIILNPALQKKPFVESIFTEEHDSLNDKLLLTFNHIKRYIDAEGNITKTDTLQIPQLDYAFNELRKKELRRIASHKTTRCAFAGYIPKETITNNRTITVDKPAQTISRIFIGCYELQQTKSFIVHNPASNHFILSVYSNYYQDGEIRQMKWLVKNDRCLYTKQKEDGRFEKDNAWSSTSSKLKRVR